MIIDMLTALITLLNLVILAAAGFLFCHLIKHIWKKHR